MTSFQLSKNIDENKVFIRNRSELEGRLDAAYYLPYIIKLEKKVRNLSKHRLRYYIEKIASGATPSVTNQDYYASDTSGVPFLRVQNLTSSNAINFENLKFIAPFVHDILLYRSQVRTGDLLIKITGVGRMAIASVAPENFEGNINQHMVSIKPKKLSSDYLASYLNLDFIEKLASRRSTGGTRPALDYTALKSIPIIEGINFSPLHIAYKEKRKKEKEAQELLDSIDDYLMKELGIELPEYDNSLNSRIFERNLSDIQGGRWDCYYNSDIQGKSNKILEKSKYELIDLKKICTFKNGYAFSSNDYVDKSDCILLTIKNINETNIDLKNSTYLPDEYYEKYRDFQIHENDILIAMTGATIGKLGLVTSNSKALLNQRVGLLKSNSINNIYLLYILNTKLYKGIILKKSVGGAQANISKNHILRIKLPVPPVSKQDEISSHIQSVRKEAEQLKIQADQQFENAKKEIEKMILGDI